MKVNICGIPHDVVEVEDNFTADSVHCGEIIYKDLIIKINKDMPQIAKDETICHEMIHGILVHLGLMDMSNDEQLVQALGNAIFQGFEVKNIETTDDIYVKLGGCEGCQYNVKSVSEEPCKNCRHVYGDKFEAKKVE